MELNVNRKRKKVEFNVHYKKTSTNITIKKKSNHKESTKRGVIKGYADRARAYCDPAYLETEIINIIDTFEDNGYSREEIKHAMKEKRKEKTEEKEEETMRGMVTMQNIPGFTPQFDKIARKHGFKTTNKTEKKVKDLVTNTKTPLGEKNMEVVYNIPCKCKKYAYTGETERKWQTRKKEHQDKVRLTEQDIQSGNTERAQERMNKSDGGLANHATTCPQEIDWENAKIVAKERKWTQRKYLEGIETIRQSNKGIKPLNSYNKMEHWQSVIYSFLQI